MKSIAHHYPEPPVNTPELYLDGLGVREIMRPGTVNRPQGIDFYLLVCFITAAENREPDGRQTILPPGTLMVWAPNTPHDFGDRHTPWNHSWLLVRGSAIVTDLKNNDIPFHTPLQLPATLRFEQTLIDINTEVSTHPRANPDYVRNLLQNLLIDLGRMQHHRTAGGWVPEDYLAVKNFIDDEFRSPLTLRQLAHQVNRSPQRFATQFKHYFGIPPIEYAIRLRLAEAAAQLPNRNLSIKDIAAATGFDSVAYFCRLFRQRFGISPGTVRAGHDRTEPQY